MTAICLLLSFWLTGQPSRDVVISTTQGAVHQPDECRNAESYSVASPEFYQEVIRYVLNHEEVSIVDAVSCDGTDEPAVRWFVQVRVSPAFEPEMLITLREWTDESADMVVVVPWGGLSFSYQLDLLVMKEKPLTAQEAAKGLAYVRIRLTQKELPEIRQLVDGFKQARLPAYPLHDTYSPDGKRQVFLYLDGPTYWVKAKSTQWSYEIEYGAADDNPLISWMWDAEERIRITLKKGLSGWLTAHALKSVDACVGRALITERAGAGELADVQQLLDLGVPVDSLEPKSRETPLHRAVRHMKRDSVQLLLKAGANPRSTTNEGLTAFGILARTSLHRGYGAEGLEIAELLVGASSPVDNPDRDGVTPLMDAVLAGDKPLTSWLARHGADARRVDAKGKSARDRATGVRADMIDALEAGR